MRRIIVVSFTALLLAACGGKSSTPPQTAGSATAPDETAPATPAAGAQGEQILAKLREYKATVCSCKDPACVEAAQKAVLEWAKQHADELQAFQPSKEEEEEGDRLENEIEACEQKIASEAPPSSSSSMTSAQILAKMEEYKTKVCACKNAACIDKVQQEMSEWANANIDAMMALKPTKAEDAQADKIQGEMEACIKKVHGKAKP